MQRSRRWVLGQMGLATTTAALMATACRRGQGEARPTDPVLPQPDYQPTGATLLTASTPAADGFYFPAEGAPHAATLMVFPPMQNWGQRRIQAARQEWAATANAIQEFEPVIMVVAPADLATAQSLLSESIELIELPVNDGWARDSGPMFVVNGQGERRVAGFTFNGWGAKFPHADDALLKARLCQQWHVPLYPSPLVLEGGGVIMDGEGTLITTEECLLHPNRNPHLTKPQVEAKLRAGLGVETIIWLTEGIVPDPVTDGHVDGLCAFVEPGVVLLHHTRDRNDPNARICAEAKRRLQATQDAQGRTLEVIDLPLASQVGHINFYLTNGGVIVPVAHQPSEDDQPLGILREVFRDRKVVPIGGTTLAAGGGGIHCITQQIPKISS